MFYLIDGLYRNDIGIVLPEGLSNRLIHVFGSVNSAYDEFEKSKEWSLAIFIDLVQYGCIK